RPLPHLLRHETGVSLATELTKLLGRNNGEAKLLGVTDVSRAVVRAADPSLHRAARVEETFLDSPFEGASVEVLLAEVLVPGIGVRVQLEEADRTVTTNERPQLRERDRVIAAERERKHPRIDEGRHRLLDLTVGALDGSRRDGRVTVVDDGQRLDDVDCEHRVVRPEEHRGRADRLRTEASTRPEARGRVEGNAEDRCIHTCKLADVWRAHERPYARKAWDDLGVKWPVGRADHR